MKVVTYTNKGRRKQNQDYLGWHPIGEDSSIFVVADGMGGYSYGDIAAQVVTDSIIEFVEVNKGKYSPRVLLSEAFKYANDSLCLKRLALGARNMGSVVVVLFILGGTAHLGWVGDSRIYLSRKNHIIFQSEDHSVINEMAKIQTLRAADYEKYASIVTQALMGDEKTLVPGYESFLIEEGDTFLLCTDGIHKEMNIDDILCEDDEEKLKAELDGRRRFISDNFTFIKVTIYNGTQPVNH